MSSSGMVMLVSKDGARFEVERDVAELSITIKNALNDTGETDEPIPLPTVTSTILTKVIEYARHHKDDPAPPPEDEQQKTRPSDDIDEWDAEFVKVDQVTLYELIMAANFLDMTNLLDLLCKVVANMMKNKTVEEIREKFGIVNDFTPEEEEEVRRENEWCEER